MFKSSGYRIGPGEIESCLIGHPAVANAAVVPKPDAERGALVKAYVVLTPEFAHRDRADVIENLQEHVRERLAPYEYPKEIEFVDELPMTTTGKIQRRILRLREEERARAAALAPAPAPATPPAPAPAPVAAPASAPAPAAAGAVDVSAAPGVPEEKQPES
ncbi:Benzoate--CoA ligase [compost metagenome]